MLDIKKNNLQKCVEGHFKQAQESAQFQISGPIISLCSCTKERQ